MYADYTISQITLKEHTHQYNTLVKFHQCDPIFCKLKMAVHLFVAHERQAHSAANTHYINKLWGWQGGGGGGGMCEGD